jgi:hypothetical protein
MGIVERRRVPIPASTSPVDIHGANASDVWLVDQDYSRLDHAVLRWNGSALEEVFRATGGHYAAIRVVSANDVWVSAGQEGIIGSRMVTYHWDGKAWHDLRRLDVATVLPVGGGRAYMLRSDGAGTMFFPSDMRTLLSYWDGATLRDLGETSASLSSLVVTGDSLWIAGAYGATLRYPVLGPTK